MSPSPSSQEDTIELDSLTEEEDRAVAHPSSPDVLYNRLSPSKRGHRQLPSSPCTPRKKVKGRQPASAAEFGDEHWAHLNEALLKLSLESMPRLYELAPDLDPWRPKGRLNEKVRQFFRHARGACMTPLPPAIILNDADEGDEDDENTDKDDNGTNGNNKGNNEPTSASSSQSSRGRGSHPVTPTSPLRASQDERSTPNKMRAYASAAVTCRPYWLPQDQPRESTSQPPVQAPRLSIPSPTHQLWTVPGARKRRLSDLPGLSIHTSTTTNSPTSSSQGSSATGTIGIGGPGVAWRGLSSPSFGYDTGGSWHSVRSRPEGSWSRAPLHSWRGSQ